MASKALMVTDTQFRFFVTGSFSPFDPATDWTIGTPDDTGVLTLAGVFDGAGRQSTKVDFGTPRPPEYALFGCIDFTGVVPTVGGTIDYYWAPSTHVTPANGNVAGNSGVDGDAPDGALGTITLDEMLKLCIFIGSLVVHDGGVVQNGFVGVLSPPTRYGQLIIKNSSDVTLEADDVEMHQVLNPMIIEGQ